MIQLQTLLHKLDNRRVHHSIFTAQHRLDISVVRSQILRKFKIQDSAYICEKWEQLGKESSNLTGHIRTSMKSRRQHAVEYLWANRRSQMQVSKVISQLKCSSMTTQADQSANYNYHLTSKMSSLSQSRPSTVSFPSRLSPSNMKLTADAFPGGSQPFCMASFLYISNNLHKATCLPILRDSLPSLLCICRTILSSLVCGKAASSSLPESLSESECVCGSGCAVGRLGMMGGARSVTQHANKLTKYPAVQQSPVPQHAA